MESVTQGQIFYCFEIYKVLTFLSGKNFQILAFKEYVVYTDTSHETKLK